MFLGLKHVGVGVKDIEKALYFYKNILGFEIMSDETGKDSSMKEFLGDSNKMRTVLLGNQKDKYCLKLVQMLGDSHADKDCSTTCEQEWGDVGYCETCWEVLNTDKFFEYVVAGGAKPAITATEFIPEIKGEKLVLRYTYVKDPDGTLVEFINPWVKRGYSLKGDDNRIIGLDHIGFGVTDMDKSIAFYKNILGFSKVIFDIEGQSSMSGYCGEALQRRLAMLTNEKGGGCLEIIQKYNKQGPKQLTRDPKWGGIGVIEMGIWVDNVDNVCDLLKRTKGCEGCVISYPSFSKYVKAKHMYVKDPDNLVIELVER